MIQRDAAGIYGDAVLHVYLSLRILLRRGNIPVAPLTLHETRLFLRKLFFEATANKIPVAQSPHDEKKNRRDT